MGRAPGPDVLAFRSTRGACGPPPPVREARMTLYLSRLTLNREAPAAALLPLLNPWEPGAAADAHHRLIWSVFADSGGAQAGFSLAA